MKIGARRVQGTRWIARALDDELPERPLFPVDPARRKAVQDAERWGEGFQNATRRIFYGGHLRRALPADWLPAHRLAVSAAAGADAANAKDVVGSTSGSKAASTPRPRRHLR